MKAYNTVVLTFILVALVAIAVFLFKLVKTDEPVTNPIETHTERANDATYNEVVVDNPANEEMVKNNNVQTPQIIGPPITKETGNVSGKLCYPSEGIPEMSVYIQSKLTKNFDIVDIKENQQTYSIEGLQPGEYTAFAYPKDTEEFGGGYTKAVPCGLNVNCTDHSLIEFTVNVN